VARVQILSRSALSGLTQPGLSAPTVAVTYAADRLAPRVVNVDGQHYREATAAELSANRNYRVLPHDDVGAEAERVAIQQDIERATAETADTFELP